MLPSPFVVVADIVKVSSLMPVEFVSATWKTPTTNDDRTRGSKDLGGCLERRNFDLQLAQVDYALK